MRRGDLIPIVLIGGIATFVAVQGVKIRRATQRAGAPSAVVQAASASAIAPQGSANVAAANRSPRPSGTIAVEGSVELRQSGEPAPERDAAATRRQIQENAAGTYVLDVLQQQNQLLMRWPDRRLNALRVWIDRHPTAAGWDPSYSLVAERVFEEWREAGFPLAFDIVPDSANTDIHIVWVTRFPPDAGRRIGVTNKTRDQYGWLRAAEVSIALHDSEGDLLPPSLVAGVVRHEVGHALGLGHSGNPADVMYPESTTPIISAADRATLHLIYTLPPGLVK